MFRSRQSLLKNFCPQIEGFTDHALHDEDLDKDLTYPIDEGKTRTRTLWHCLVHVVNHGTQHRSEAAVLLTRYGQSPGDLDFTIFLNQHKP